MSILPAAPDKVCWIVLANDARSGAITPSSLARLNAELVKFDERPDYRTGILVGPGGGAFAPSSSDSFAQVDATESMESVDGPRIPPLAIYRTEKMMVAAANGDCVDEALIAYAQVGDIRIAGRSARFGFPALRSRPLAAGVRSRLHRQIPYTSLARLLFTGDLVDASEALRIGLVSEVVEDGELLARACRHAAAIAALPPFASRGEKHTMARAESLGFEASRHYAVTVDMMSHVSPDGLEGIASFVEKRPPRFWDFTKD